MRIVKIVICFYFLFFINKVINADELGKIIENSAVNNTETSVTENNVDEAVDEFIQEPSDEDEPQKDNKIKRVPIVSLNSKYNDMIPSFVIIDKINNEKKEINIMVNEKKSFKDIEIILETCTYNSRTLESSSKVKIIDKKTTITLYDGYLYAPVRSKGVFLNKFFVVNLISCH
jgi:hypothetical protein